MDKYIYILVGIIWVINNIYKSFQKGNASEKKSQTQKRVEKPLQKSIKNNPQPSRQKNTRNNTSKSFPSQEIIFSETDAEVANANTFSYEKQPIENVSTTNTMPLHADESTMDGIEIDFKKAIIYSEIINKPKYLSED